MPRVGFPNTETFRAAYEEAGAWLDALPFDAARIVLGGFSQGAVMSFALGLGRGRPKPAAIVALSGFVPTVDGWEPELEGRAPVAMGHGTLDPVIPVGFARAARNLLGPELYREYPLPHAIDPSFPSELRPWIADRLQNPYR